MTFGGQIRLAGAVVSIIGAITNIVVLSLVGLMVMAIGAIWQIDTLERRVNALESKGNSNDETEA